MVRQLVTVVRPFAPPSSSATFCSVTAFLPYDELRFFGSLVRGTPRSLYRYSVGSIVVRLPFVPLLPLLLFLLPLVGYRCWFFCRS